MNRHGSEADEMVARHLRGRGIRDPSVLAAMLAVPRQAFVPDDLTESAYADHPLPIGLRQTISQPYIVALMLEAARLTPDAHVLDVGTGSGYAAAVAAEIARDVVSIERLPALARTARSRLDALGYERVRIVVGDGTRGVPDAAPFDAIIAAAAGPEVPDAWLEQLTPGGRIVMPLDVGRGDQELVVLTREADGRMARRSLGAVIFVPLIGRGGFRSE
ncbi:MAG: protein-L-isoaspartate(D-aspartate) O-methyltransferase [Leifsonia sp.]